jgi:hypothetical protein
MEKTYTTCTPNRLANLTGITRILEKHSLSMGAGQLLVSLTPHIHMHTPNAAPLRLLQTNMLITLRTPPSWLVAPHNHKHIRMGSPPTHDRRL